MTCGLNNLSNTNLPLLTKTVAGSFILSFGGLSIILQSMEFLKNTSINPFLFVLTKIINAVLTSVITYLFIAI